MGKGYSKIILCIVPTFTQVTLRVKLYMQHNHNHNQTSSYWMEKLRTEFVSVSHNLWKLNRYSQCGPERCPCPQTPCRSRFTGPPPCRQTLATKMLMKPRVTEIFSFAQDDLDMANMMGVMPSAFTQAMTEVMYFRCKLLSEFVLYMS